MRVHVVCRDHQSDWIIARLVRHLMRANGWTAGKSPDATADINVFFPYLDWRLSRFAETPTAGWFTHREAQRPDKARIWDETAARLSLRITPSRMYAAELEKHGPTVHIPHPVELDKFVVADGIRSGKTPVVGVSGFVYPGGRKGEELAARLSEERTGRWRIRASGRGWPVETTHYPWVEMQRFYQGLDVYLCTALAEGGPVTVLEALACGVPVVVPRGVGQMDELPEMAGVWHYDAGDYEGMVAALESAVRCKVRPEMLRVLVEQYTVQRWCDSWLAVLETFLAPPGEGPRPEWRGNAGVYLVAYGEPSRECAKRAIASLRRYMPGLPVALVSDRALGPEDVLIEKPDLDVGGRSLKTQIYDLAPQEWHYIWYLDADCELTAPVPFLFDLLEDGWDMCVCTTPDKYHTTARMVRPDNREECEETYALMGTREALQLQGGVFSFCRNSRTETFFRAWHEGWLQWRRRDQAALLRALYTHPLALYVLGIEWNTSTRYPSPNGTAGILHHQMEARRWRGILPGANDSEASWRVVREWERANQ